MDAAINWRIAIKDGFKAHFNQPEGPSLPGTDWAIELHDGVKGYRILVRAYAHDVAGLTTEQERRAVAACVAQLLQQGWNPAQWKGLPGELAFKKSPPENRMPSSSMAESATESLAWRLHPKLQGKFHPEHPDDVQVMVHDGGPRFTKHRPEIVWVRITACSEDIFAGRVLNQPQHLTTVRQGSSIRFIVPDTGLHPLMTSEKYLQERAKWVIEACAKCGVTELLDAPSDIIRAAFSGLAAGRPPELFTVRCGVCGGAQVVRQRESLKKERT